MEQVIHVMNSQLLTLGVSSFLAKQKVCEGVIEALFITLNSYLVRQDKKQVCSILLYCLLKFS